MRSMLVAVAVVMLLAGTAYAIDIEHFGGINMAGSSESAGSGAICCGIAGSGGTSQAISQATVNWNGPHFEVTNATQTEGGTISGALGFAGAGAIESAHAFSATWYHGMHFGF